MHKCMMMQTDVQMYRDVWEKICQMYTAERDLHSCEDVQTSVWMVGIRIRRRKLFSPFQIILQTSHRTHFS